MKPLSREAFPPLCDLLEKAVDGGRSSMEFHILRLAFRRAVVVEHDPADVTRDNAVTPVVVTAEKPVTVDDLRREIALLQGQVRGLTQALHIAKTGQAPSNKKRFRQT